MSHVKSRRFVRNVVLSAAFTCSAAFAFHVLLPFSVAALALGIIVVSAHEVGHAYSAWLHNGNPDVPIVVPLGIAVVGITRVRNLPHLSRRARRYIIAAGPIAGTLTAIALAPYAIMFGGTMMVWTVFGLIAVELYGGTIGSDGQKWRRDHRRYGTT